jgi:hypothetical protein
MYYLCKILKSSIVSGNKEKKSPQDTRMHSHPDIVAIGRWARVNLFALARWVTFSGPLVDPFGLRQ